MSKPAPTTITLTPQQRTDYQRYLEQRTQAQLRATITTYLRPLQEPPKKRD